MRSKEHLLVTYEQQKSNWNTSQKQKLQNLEKRREQQLASIARTQKALADTEMNIEKTRNESFPTFDEFFRNIQLQSDNAKRTKKGATESLSTNQIQ